MTVREMDTRVLAPDLAAFVVLSAALCLPFWVWVAYEIWKGFVR